MRTLRGVVLGVVVLVLASGVAGWAYIRSAAQPRAGTEVVAGLEQPVDVLWTEHAVPHVFAGRLEDAVFAQGLLHARDRLWQMELVRRAVQGRLAEVMGEPALSADRFLRRLQLWEAAKVAVDSLGPVERRILEAYADGVNAALDAWDGALPPEFVLLGYEPEPWEPVHTLAVAKMMSYTLAAYGQSTSVARAVRRLSPDRLRWLFPELPGWGEFTILPPAPPATPPLAAALIDGFSMATASNSWAVSGSRTASGHPILANDMHLELQSPSLWYLMGLHAPGTDTAPALDAVGVTIPGGPLVIVGRNRAVAWGMTSTTIDDVDLFMERVDPDDPGRYLTPDGSRPFEVVAESIAVKGREEPIVMQVRRTRHGPVLPLADGASGDTVLAVRWTAHQPTTIIRAISGFNLAADWEDFLVAADYMNDPHQNLVYADTAGHIGYVMSGTVPIRGDRRPATLVPRPGWTGDWDWTGELPFAEHPRALDPPAGFVVTANNQPVDGPRAALLAATWTQPFRAMRITEMIEDAQAPLTPAGIHAMQMDLLDLYARRYADRAAAAAEEAGLTAAARTLRDWDHRANAGSRAAALFYTWDALVRSAIARDLYDGPPAYFPRWTAMDVLEEGAVPWAEAPAAAYRAMAADAIREAVERVGGRSWGASIQAVHGHALGDVGLLDRLLGLDVGPHPTEGATFTVKVAKQTFQGGDAVPFQVTWGVSQRLVTEMGNTEPTAGLVIPTGQSGLPFSRHYDDQMPMWRSGGLLSLPLDRGAVEASAEQRLRLDPQARDAGR